MPHGSQISSPPTFFLSIHSSFPASNTRKQLLVTPQLSRARKTGKPTEDLNHSLLPSKSRPPVSSPGLQQSTFGSLLWLLVPIFCESHRPFSSNLPNTCHNIPAPNPSRQSYYPSILLTAVLSAQKSFKIMWSNKNKLSLSVAV